MVIQVEGMSKGMEVGHCLVYAAAFLKVARRVPLSLRRRAKGTHWLK